MKNIQITFHGGIRSGKFTALSFLKEANLFSELLSHEVVSLPSGTKYTGGNFDDLGNICKFNLDKYPDITFEIHLVSGAIWEEENINKFLFSKCQGILFFFDISKTYDINSGIEQWRDLPKKISRYQQKKIDNFPIVLCFNKIDNALPKIDRKVFNDYEEMNQRLNNHHFPYFATSAKKGTNLYNALITLIDIIKFRSTKS